MRYRPKPLSKDPISTTITGLSHEGRGIGSALGKTTFVEGALPNEQVEVVLTAKSGSHFTGRAITIANPHPQRVQPACQHAEICGGCSLQHLSSESQIEHKHRVLQEQFQHFGKITAQSWLDPIRGPVWGYRRKARLGVKLVPKKGGIIVGFREKHSHLLADIHHCEVLDPSVASLLDPLRELIIDLSINNAIPQIEVAVGDDNTALIIRHLQEFNPTDHEKLIHFANKNKLHIYLQPQGLSSIWRLWPESGSERLHYHLPDHNLIFEFHPADFTQVNNDINQKMVNQALALLSLTEEDVVLDLFCGLGNFSLAMARLAKQVIGVEGAELMVKRAQENAQLNSLTNTEFFCADLNKDFTDHTFLKRPYTKALLDPPRSGAATVIPHLAKLGIEKIVYVSCNPATLARDAGLLVHEYHYKLITAGVMDMFPHTSHVESIALFTK